MSNNKNPWWWISFCIILFATIMVFGQDDTEQKIKTAYNSQGRPTYQSQGAKGWHIVVDSVALSGGKATVELNRSTAEGRKDVSFRDRYSYSGIAWTTDSTDTNSYRVVPITGYRLIVKSGDSSDSGTVYYRLEGE